MVRLPELEPRSHLLERLETRETMRNDAFRTHGVDEAIERRIGPIVSDPRSRVKAHRLEHTRQSRQRFDGVVSDEALEHSTTTGLVVHPELAEVTTETV